MFFGTRHLESLILAVALVAASTFCRAECAGERDTVAAQVTDSQLSASVQHGPSWTIRTSDAPRICPFTTHNGPTMVTACDVLAVRLESLPQNSAVSMDIRHRIQRIERLLLRL